MVVKIWDSRNVFWIILCIMNIMHRNFSPVFLDKQICPYQVYNKKLSCIFIKIYMIINGINGTNRINNYYIRPRSTQLTETMIVIKLEKQTESTQNNNCQDKTHKESQLYNTKINLHKT